MLLIIAILLAALWTVGLFTSYSLGGFIHVLVAAAIGLLIFQITKDQGGRKVQGRVS